MDHPTHTSKTLFHHHHIWLSLHRWYTEMNIASNLLLLKTTFHPMLAAKSKEHAKRQDSPKGKILKLLVIIHLLLVYLTGQNLKWSLKNHKLTIKFNQLIQISASKFIRSLNHLPKLTLPKVHALMQVIKIRKPLLIKHLV